MLNQVNLFLVIVFWIFISATAIQLFYYLWLYLAVPLNKSGEKKTARQPVSIIICARNEAENLDKFLPSVLKQKYPEYEVIVVNDCSEDNSYDILGKYLLEYPHLKVSTINKDPKFTHNKKLAQFIGIKASKYDLLLFTDADCEPDSDKWLDGMAANFEEKITFVLGYGGYFVEKGLLNKFIRYDSMTIAMQYMGMAIRGLPYMGVGRNLAYRRSLFFANKGYGAHNQLASGDDDLIVNSNATSDNTAVEFSPGTHTRSVPASSMEEFIKQKKRHYSTAPHYKLRDKAILFVEPVTRVLFYSSLAVLLSFLLLWPYVLAIFGFRLIVQIIVLIFVSKKFKEPGIVTFSLFFDIFSPLIYTTIYLSKPGSKSGRNRWK
ncbi:MAG TPA: glycosyltransferase [Bacteroidales bacterium]|nr:glycosyltransferase [Bacteroidales bacterium]